MKLNQCRTATFLCLLYILHEFFRKEEDINLVAIIVEITAVIETLLEIIMDELIQETIHIPGISILVLLS